MSYTADLKLLPREPGGLVQLVADRRVVQHRSICSRIRSASLPGQRVPVHDAGPDKHEAASPARETASTDRTPGIEEIHGGCYLHGKA